MSRIVLKLGGGVAAAAVGDVHALAAAGHEVCVVHGAGPQITAALERRGLDVSFVRGRRVTSADALPLVREVLAAVNRQVCTALGSPAVGFMGDDVGLLAERIEELGFVGDPRPTRPSAIESALVEGLIPVVAPLAAGPLNVNADEAAAALAVGLGADRIHFVSDVPGVYVAGGVVAALPADDADRLLGAGELAGGIVPKLNAAVRAARLGVRAEIGETAVVP